MCLFVCCSTRISHTLLWPICQLSRPADSSSCLQLGPSGLTQDVAVKVMNRYLRRQKEQCYWLLIYNLSFFVGTLNLRSHGAYKCITVHNIHSSMLIKSSWRPIQTLRVATISTSISDIWECTVYSTQLSHCFTLSFVWSNWISDKNWQDYSTCITKPACFVDLFIVDGHP